MSELETAITVNDDTPLTLPQLPLIWLRADQGVWKDTGATVPVSTTGDGVAYWTNRGTGSNFTQATSGSQPTLQNNAMNGKPALLFNNTNSQYLSSVSTAPVPTSFTVFWVASIFVTPNSLGRQDMWLGGMGNAGTVHQTLDMGLNDSTSSPNLVMDWDDWGGRLFNNTSPYFQLHKPFVYSASYDSNVLTTYIDGDPTVPATLSHTWPTNTGTWYIGDVGAGDQPRMWDGYIAEYIVYTSSLSSKNLEEVHNYLESRYNI